MSDATASGGRLGRYHLVEPLGGGANGEVHRAKVYGVAGFERQFAVKKFFPHVALNPRYAQALSAAARAYGSLEHPRIARLAEFGVSSGHTFTATELVPGLDAARLLTETLAAGGAIPAGSALSLISQAARAVGYAHGRGISHLGVCPTNLVVSPDGEVKVTDIGVLGACLPDRPAHDGRFVTRVHYLAPEQLTGEPTSAATDVFALGLIAYELVTGERAFVGDSAVDVAQAILTGQPREPQLPRPIMRVLQRCLARSPYERFPDARALADALDAALRVSPVPGTRGEVAELVTAALDRIAVLHEQQLSGALQLNLPSAGRADTLADRALGDPDLQTVPFNRESAERTLPEMQKTPATTMQGMAPPPIPVPQGVSGPTRTSQPFPGPIPTIQGVPPMKAPRATTGGIPPPIPRPVTARSDVTDVTPQPAPMSDKTPPPIPVGASSRRMPAVSPNERFTTSDPTIDSRRLPTGSEPIDLASLGLDSRPSRSDSTGQPVADPRRPTTGEPVESLLSSSTLLPPLPANPVPSKTVKRRRGASAGAPTEHVVLAGKSRTGLKIAVALLALGAGFGGVFAWQYYADDGEEPGPGPSKPIAGAAGKDAAGVVATAGDAATAPPVTPDAAVAMVEPTGDAATGVVPPPDPIDAEAIAVAPDAAAAIAVAPPDAAAAAVAPDAGGAVMTPSDKLVIDSKPKGARVFLDGADQGETPITLPGSADRHSVALVLPAHAPYIAEIDGKGQLAIDLEEVVPSAGPAGIKIKCREKGRYVVFLDGKPTGQLCPTERLEVELGEHLIEIYDLVTETRRQYPCNVKETRLSLRIKLDY